MNRRQFCEKMLVLGSGAMLVPLLDACGRAGQAYCHPHRHAFPYQNTHTAGCGYRDPRGHGDPRSNGHSLADGYCYTLPDGHCCALPDGHA